MKPDPDGNNGFAWVLPASIGVLVMIYLVAQMLEEIAGWL